MDANDSINEGRTSTDLPESADVEVVENDSAGATSAEEVKKEFLLDRVGDVFQKMTVGIFRFAFVKLPVFLFRQLFNWERWRDVFMFLKRAGRAIFWMAIWFVVAFAAWIAFDLQAFVSVWASVWNFIWGLIVSALVFVKEWFNVIWTVIALLGSMYGLAYVTLRKRAEKRGVVFRGVFKRNITKKEAASSDVKSNEP